MNSASEITTEIPVDPVTNEELEKHGGFTMRLASVGNPDFSQYAPVSPPKTVKAATLKEMRALAEKYQEEWDLGGGNWVDPVVKIGKRVVGHFSYNLRFWEGKPSKDWTKRPKEILIQE